MVLSFAFLKNLGASAFQEREKSFRDGHPLPPVAESRDLSFNSI